MDYSKYKRLLSPIKVGNTILRNRIFRGASVPHYLQGPEEYPTENTIAHYGATARGGAAVVVCSGATLYPDTGIPAHYINGNLRNVRGQNYFAQMADAVHFGGAKAALNLPTPWKAGYDVSAGIPVRFTVSDEPVSESEVSKEISPEMLDGFIDEYLELCHIAKHCGFDMVYIHMAYHYALLDRFLSPLLNHRTDEYGGCIENRAKPAIKLFKRIKEELGRDFLIEISISPEEGPGGMTMDDTVRFIELVQDYVDFVQPRAASKELSNAVGFRPPQPLRPLAREFKQRVKDLNVLVVASGGYHDPEICEDVLETGDADIIDIARGWISNPDFGKMLYEGKEKEIIPCVLCNKCHACNEKDPYISVCSVNPYLGYDDRADWMIRKPERKKKVAVVGGGPGGMRAALLCQERGHQVTLFEKTSILGGMLAHTDYVSFKWPLKRYKDWLIRQVFDKEIEIRIRTKATRELLEKEGYEEVIVSVGASPAILPVPGADGKNVLTAPMLFGREETVDKRVVVIGGGEIGVECAIHLCMLGRQVTVLEMTDKLAPDANPVHYRESLEDAWKAQSGFSAILNARCVEIDAQGVLYLDEHGDTQKLEAGTVILAAGMRPNQNEALALFSPFYRCHIIGDCDRPGNIQKVNRSALAAASQI